MKDQVYKCDSTEPLATKALEIHRNTYPNGREVYSGRSNTTHYVSEGYKIYETRTTVVIDLMRSL